MSDVSLVVFGYKNRSLRDDWYVKIIMSFVAFKKNNYK